MQINVNEKVMKTTTVLALHIGVKIWAFSELYSTCRIQCSIGDTVCSLVAPSNLSVFLVIFVLYTAVLRIRDVYPGTRIQKQEQKRGLKKISCHTFLQISKNCKLFYF